MDKKTIENAKLAFISRKINEEQDRFKVLESSDRLLDFQYQSDNVSLMSFLTNWIKKAKTDTQKKILSDNLGALIRIGSYVTTMQTVSKGAVSRLITETTAHNRLVKKYSKLEKENETLKKIIADYENGRI